LLLLYRRVIIPIKGKEDLLYPFNKWFAFFLELIYRLLPSIINYQKFGRTASFLETAGKQNTREQCFNLWSKFQIDATFIQRHDSLIIPLKTLFDPLWIYVSVESIPSAPSKPV
jgi:hypothetical protein